MANSVHTYQLPHSMASDLVYPVRSDRSVGLILRVFIIYGRFSISNKLFVWPTVNLIDISSSKQHFEIVFLFLLEKGLTFYLNLSS